MTCNAGLKIQNYHINSTHTHQTMPRPLFVNWGQKGRNYFASILFYNKNQMNFHNLASQGRGLDSLRETAPATAKEEKELFQSTLSKHFQIIQTFLEKINELYNKNEDFQHTLNKLEDKIQKLETNTKNIHYEFRTTHLMIDKKLNSMNSDYNHIQEAVKTIQRESHFDSYLSSKHFLNKSGRVKARKSKKPRRAHKQKSQAYKIAVLSSNQLNLTGERDIGNRFTLNSDQGTEINSKLALLKHESQSYPNSGFRHKEVFGSQSSVKIDSNPYVSIKSFRESSDYNEQQPKKVEKMKGYDPKERQWEDESESEDLEWVKEYLSQELEQRNSRLQEKIEKLNQEQKQHEQTSTKTKDALSQILSNMVKHHHLEELRQNIRKQMDAKLENHKTVLETVLLEIKNQILFQNKVQISNLQQAYKDVNSQKVEVQDFQNTVKKLTNTIHQELAKHQRSFAKKDQTKKAIQFLDVKLNKFITDQTATKSKNHFGGTDDPFLKINRCESIKKIDIFSDKSIRDKLEESQNFKSLQTSMQFIEPQKRKSQEQAKFQRVASQVISWKNQNLLETENLKKATRSTCKERDQQKRGSAPQPQVNQKEWREKVVKILRKEDRRRRKVTFR